MKGFSLGILRRFQSTLPFLSSKENYGCSKVSSNVDSPETFPCSQTNPNPRPSCQVHDHDDTSRTTGSSSEEDEYELRSQKTIAHSGPNDNSAKNRDCTSDGFCTCSSVEDDDTVFEDCRDDDEEGLCHDDLLEFNPSPEIHEPKKIKEGGGVQQGLEEFESRCPPGGSDSVILYTTSFRGIRKTFEDCSNIKFLLDSFNILYYERDLSLHLEFREELWRVLGCKAIPPRLFIRGRHIGGADEVVELHEQGKLKNLLQGIPLSLTNRNKCGGCAGVAFVLCSDCHGSRKLLDLDGKDVHESFSRCSRCNENGLIKCPICCY